MNKKRVITIAALGVLVMLVCLWLVARNSDSSESSNKKRQPSVATRMNLKQIKQGDFSSVAGTWKNRSGAISIDKNGHVTGKVADGSVISGDLLADNRTDISDNAKPELTSGLLEMKFKPSDSSQDSQDKNHSWDTYFIPAGESFQEAKSDSDRVYLGQNLNENEIYTWSSTKQKTFSPNNSSSAQSSSSSTDPTPVSPEIAALSTADKNALALLGLPSGFEVTYGEISGDDILNGSYKPTGQLTDQNNQPVSTINFTGISLTPGSDGSEGVMTVGSLTGLMSGGPHGSGNRYVDSFQILGNTVKYTIVGQDSFSGTSKRIVEANLSDLYNQYKDTGKIEQMKQRIVQGN